MDLSTPGHKTDNPQDIEYWRSRLAQRMIVLFGVTAIIFTPFLVLTSETWTNYIFAVLAAFLFVGMSFLPHRFYVAKIFLVLLLLFAQGTAVSINHPINGIGPTYYVVTVAIASMFYGRIPGLIVLLILTIATAANFNLTYTGADPIASRTWFWQPIAIVVGSFIVNYSADYLTAGLVSALQIVRNEKENSERMSRIYRLIAENSADVVVELDGNLEVTYVSPSVRTLLNFTPGAFKAKFSELFETSALFRNLKNDITTKRASENREELPIEQFHHQLVTPDNRFVNLEIDVTRGQSQGAERYIMSIHDVTAQTALHGQLAHAQRIESLGQLASGVAHDFNNILAIIQGNAEIIEMAPDQTSDSIEAILRSVEKGNALTDQILSLSRKHPDQKNVLDVTQVLRESMVLFNTIKSDKVSIETTLPDDPIYVLGEAAQLSQVFLNVAVNARDAMPDGGKIQVSASLLRSEAPAVKITFTDSGIGMSADMLDRIFEPYFTTKSMSGTGLGLATCRSIIEHHDGSIDAESVVNEGSQFFIQIPLAEGSPQDDVGHSEPTETGVLSILVVDDNKELLELIQRTLTRLGHQVTTAADGLEALEVIKTNQLDVVVSDINMPHLNGLELSKQVSDTPVILMSGYASPAITEQLDEMEILKKPFKMSQLLERIHSALEQQGP